MVIEIQSVIVSTFVLITFWDVRYAFDFGYPATEEELPPTLKLIGLSGLQIVCVAIVDIMSQYQELIQGIPLLNCWKGRKW